MPEHPAIALLEAAATALRDEALSLPDALYRPMPARERYEGAWRGVVLRAGKWEREYVGVDFDANRASCPVAMGVLARIPGVAVAGYLRLDPRTVLVDHVDERDDEVLRVHVGLQLPPEERAYWPEGTARWLDVRVPHGAKNDSDQPRVTFVVDLRFPTAMPTGALPRWGPP